MMRARWRPPDKREGRPAKAALCKAWVDWNEWQNNRSPRRPSIYRTRPTVAALVLQSLLRCGGWVRA